MDAVGEVTHKLIISEASCSKSVKNFYLERATLNSD